MPEAGQDPEKNGPLLTPRGKALLRKVVLLPVRPFIWAGQTLSDQVDRLFVWTMASWEKRNERPPPKTLRDRAGRAGLWMLYVYLKTFDRLGDGVQAWWDRRSRSSTLPQTSEPTRTVADRLASLKTATVGVVASLQKSAAEWQAKRAAEKAEAEKQANAAKEAAAKDAAEKKAAAERVAAAAAKPVPQKPAAAPVKVAAFKGNAGGTTVNGVPLSQFPEEFRELAEIVDSLKIVEASRDHMIGMLQRRELQELKAHLEYKILPYLPDGDRRQLLENTGTGARWASDIEMLDAGLACHQSKRPPDSLYLGSYELDSGNHVLLEFSGEGHLITVAPTGAGKTSAHVLPAAVFYRGPIVCFDPKGEVYEDSKWSRRRRGKVFKWAPYATDYEGDGFNPLDFVRSYDDAATLAHMLIPSPPSGVDPFWVDATRELVAGGLWFEILTEPPGEATIAGVYRRLNNLRRTIPNQFDEHGQPIFMTRLRKFREELIQTGDPNLDDLAESLEDMEDNEKQLTSYAAHMRANMAIWARPEIAKATARTREGFYPESIWMDGQVADYQYPPGGYDPMSDAIRPGYHSVFLIVPPTKIDVTAPVVRVILHTIIHQMMKASAEAPPDPPGKEVTYCPVLFLIDEFPQLGYMDVIEKSIAIVRSANLRFWLFVQDLNQLRTTYAKWQSILANTRAKLYFQCNDMETAEEVSKLVGERREFFSGRSRRLATPQELMGQEFAGKQIIKLAGYNPVKSHLAMMHRYPDFVAVVQRNRDDNERVDVPG